MSLKVEVTDRETGQRETVVVADDDYLILCVGKCYVDGVQSYPAKGTHVLTVKNCRPRPIVDPPVVPAHLEVIWTDRGFKHMPGLTGSRDEAVSVYESSAAMAPHVYLNIEPCGLEPAYAHLTLEAASQLRDQIDYLIRNHYQLEVRDGGVSDG